MDWVSQNDNPGDGWGRNDTFLVNWALGVDKDLSQGDKWVWEEGYDMWER